MRSIAFALFALATFLLTNSAKAIRVTFSVDMSNQAVSASGVHLAGNFQKEAGFTDDWDPSTTVMLDTDGDEIYKVTLDIPSGYWEFKYVNGNTWPEAENAQGSCTVGGTNNRFMTIGNSDTILDIVEFDKCPFKQQEKFDYPDTAQSLFWWNNTVFYEIFVRSFADSDGDGIGDFQGIIDKINYLNDNNPNTSTDLGIGGIWLMPMMKSTSYHGYDVEDYYAVEEDYGSMEDFERLLDTCHAHGIKVIIDLVINHTSSNHPWFTKSAANDPKYRSWYRWDNNPPTDLGPWGQQLWHARNGSNYYGIFWSGMPDLNYDEPDVYKEIEQITEFWLDKGVDGFRLDAIKYLDEDGTVVENTPETFKILNALRKHVRSINTDAFLVGEVWDATPKVLPYVSDTTLNSCFDFTLADRIRDAIFNGNAEQLNSHLLYIQENYPLSQYSTFLSNHDQNRIFSVLNRNDWMKLSASIYLTLPGMPFVYYGEEIGMTGTGDHLNIRTPMQWTGNSYAGFSTTSPWRGFAQDYTINNVDIQQSESTSIWNHYHRLINLRNQSESLREGIYWPISSNHSSAFVYARTHGKTSPALYTLVLHNLGTNTIPNIGKTTNALLPSGTRYLSDALSGEDLGEITVDDSGCIVSWSKDINLSSYSSKFIHIWEAKTTSSRALQIPKFRLYPNPSCGDITLDAGKSKIKRIQVVSVSGRILVNQYLSAPLTSVRQSLKGLATGIYVVKVTLESGEIMSEQLMKYNQMY